MRINYALDGGYACFYQLHLASRHIKVAFSSSSKINELAKQHVIAANNTQNEISLFERAVHVIAGSFEAIPMIGLIIALIDRYFYSTVLLPIPDGTGISKTPPQSSILPSVTKKELSSEQVFGDIDSSFLTMGNNKIKGRSSFLAKPNWQGATPPPIISQSRLVPDWMVEGLMREKKDSALGVKYKVGDAITNMEGVMHTFLVPVASIKMLGDYNWNSGHNISKFQSGETRNVLLSAAIQPDFESDTVMMKLCALGRQEIQGSPYLNYTQFPSRAEKSDNNFREGYDAALKKYLIHHLTSQQKLPPLSRVTPMSSDDAITHLESLIKNDHASFEDLADKHVALNGHVISLEILFNVYVEQLRAEFDALDHSTVNNYVYTINPPSIFTAAMEKTVGAKVLNRLQALAFKKLLLENDFAKKLSQVGISDYVDDTIVSLLGTVFSKEGIDVVSKSELFSGTNGTYNGPDGMALVIHNNSDAFGQNIETEGPTSLDGVIGSYSDAACALHRKRPDLLEQLICRGSA